MVAANTRPVVIAFRRRSFYGDFASTVPRWHLLKGEEPDRWGTYVAYCGYTLSNILGDLKVSRSKTPKKRAESCSRCVKALGKEQSEQRDN